MNKLICGTAILLASTVVNASSYAINYTGTVNGTYLYGAAPLPDGIMVGSLINGSFSLNTDNAATPNLYFWLM